MTSTSPWDESYTGSTPAPWDIGRPQPAFAGLARDGRLRGRVLDVGCGTGEHTLLAATVGADALGVDISQAAIAQAREKAATRDVEARFQVADALHLAELGETFDTLIDSGAFHVFSDDDRPEYVASLASVTRPGGHCHLMCFSERQPGTGGPRRVTQDELRAAFRDGWTVVSIAADTFTINPGFFDGTTAHAWRADIRRD
jgi:cyclopropane fatty-acyl-phospholipid synthase-like methyltransferase